VYITENIHYLRAIEDCNVEKWIKCSQMWMESQDEHLWYVTNDLKGIERIDVLKRQAQDSCIPILKFKERIIANGKVIKLSLHKSPV
jgi:hypothetical protein